MPCLSAVRVRDAKPREKPYKLFDERGLFLLVVPSADQYRGRLWRFRYRVNGVEKLLALGSYPDVSLKRAREKRDEARRLLADGVDPNVQRKTERAASTETFEAIGREWLAHRAKTTAAITQQKATWLLEQIFAEIGSRPIREVAAPELLAALRKIEARGHHESAHRAKQKCGQVFRYAIATGRAERDISADLRGALVPVVSKNHAALTDPAEVGALLRAIDRYGGQPVTAAALKLAPLVFVRPGELRGARWAEIDLDAGEWRIPAERMKMGQQHIVPLSHQAAAILRDLRALTGYGDYVFPSLLSAARPMSNNTINTALRRLGYTKEQMTGHGFRAMASTMLNEKGFPPDVIELQLAHEERNKIRAAYNRAKRLAERRNMMQSWADYVDLLRDRASNGTN
ncbi:MAG: tyrosine-type recombinase/integrase [Proteobacteria bacterium]|nr:tyrosine-type recombinase/integrase [Pseudomonadota bacterium]